MKYLMYLPWLLVLFCIYLVLKSKGQEEKIPDEKVNLPLKGVYQRKWMFSPNEKEAYHKLKDIAEKNGYTVFSKVRLLDLLEPRSDNQKKKTYFYKVQAKHVDFVLCDSKLVARYVIELDDSSHDRSDRKQRDEFVDTILQDVGYKILHTRGITPEEIETFLRPNTAQLTSQ